MQLTCFLPFDRCSATLSDIENLGCFCYNANMKLSQKARLFVFAMALLLSASVLAGENSNGSQNSMTTDLGLGVGSALANVVYVPAKVVYAGLGLLTGGAAYVLTGGSSTVANRILTPSVRGTYVITPRHLTGEEPVEFVGKAPPPPQS
jgi:hypothetical protein